MLFGGRLKRLKSKAKVDTLNLLDMILFQTYQLSDKVGFVILLITYSVTMFSTLASLFEATNLFALVINSCFVAHGIFGSVKS